MYFEIGDDLMDKLIVYADPKMPDQRVYQLDDKIAEEAFMDTMDSFIGSALSNDLGMETPGDEPKHNIVAQLQQIDGVGMITFASPNYTVFINDNASWEVIDPKIREVLAKAFGEIGELNFIESSLTE
ncbi:MAG: hypothetical protein ACNFW9_03625 [Candidatus Kerfeldbacteria bacterium]